MKHRITLTMLSVLIAMAVISATGNSQNNFSGPRNMGRVLNSTSGDQTPVISPSGLSMYFASNRTGGSGGNDIYVSQRATLNSLWGAPQNLGATVNSTSADNPASFSHDGKTMFLGSTRPGGFGGRDIYMTTRLDPTNDFGWTTPVNLGAVVNTAVDELVPEYFEDPASGVRSIIFGTNREPNPVVYHLYQSTRNTDGTFNPPTPISETYVGAEIRAAIRRDGLEMFIAAILPPPQLDFDIYVTTRASTTDPWRTPQLVPGISSALDDWTGSLSPDGSILYFSIAPINQSGPGDLYSVTRCSLYSASSCTVDRAPADFDGDGRSDIGVFRPSDGNWYIMKSATGTFRSEHFGQTSDKIVPGDYDGDGLIDLAVFRPSDRNWYIRQSSDPGVTLGINWGFSTDKLVPGDYDGDGRTDVAVYRDGTWYVLQSSTGQFTAQQFGLSGDIPITGTNAQ